MHAEEVIAIKNVNRELGLIETIEMVERLIGEGKWHTAASFFTPDVMYKVAGRAPVYGVNAIREYMVWQSRLVHWVGHSVRLTMSDEDVAIIEVDSHFYRLSDQANITVPCTDIYRFEESKINEWRVYADISVFSS